MATEQNRSDQLTAFKLRDKFGDAAWEARGLNPSGSAIIDILTKLFHQCADALIEAVHRKATARQLKRVLKEHLARFNKRIFDTEEKEFIGDLFCELAAIVKIDFTSQVTRWSYGPILSTLLQIRALLKPERVQETIQHSCPSCGTALDTFLMRKEEGIPDRNWQIIRCKNCRDYSLLSLGPDVKEVRFDQYTIVEQLPKEDFTREQADMRLEQIRHFRR